MDRLKGPKIDISLHGKKEERHSLIRVSRKLPRNCDTAKDTSESTVFNDQSLWCYLSTRFWLWSKLIGWRLRGKRALWPVVFLLVCICSRGRPIDLVLQIRPINIQVHLQATRDAASCGKQIVIPLAQRTTMWCPPLPANFLKRELPGNS